MKFQVLTWSVADPFGTLWHFATKKAAELFIQNECGSGFRYHAKLLEL